MGVHKTRRERMDERLVAMVNRTL